MLKIFTAAKQPEPKAYLKLEEDYHNGDVILTAVDATGSHVAYLMTFRADGSIERHGVPFVVGGLRLDSGGYLKITRK
jgi:hypothetical protein